MYRSAIICNVVSHLLPVGGSNMKNKLEQLSQKYHNLDPVIQQHYNHQLLFILMLYVFPIVAQFSIKSLQVTIFSILCITGYLCNQLYQIWLFCNERITKITGECIDIQETKISTRSLLFYGKCTLYLREQEKIYEIQIPHHTIYKEDMILHVWYDGNSFRRNGNIYAIPSVYIISVEKK